MVSRVWRQYVGLHIRGRQLVYVNGFTSAASNAWPGRGRHWRTRAVNVCDGGCRVSSAPDTIRPRDWEATLLFSGNRTPATV